MSRGFRSSRAEEEGDPHREETHDKGQEPSPLRTRASQILMLVFPPHQLGLSELLGSNSLIRGQIWEFHPNLHASQNKAATEHAGFTSVCFVFRNQRVQIRRS